MIARVINLLGIPLGDEHRLMPPDPKSNPAGFWEHEDVVRLNDELLAAKGGTWLRPPVLQGQWYLAPELTPLRERARALLDREVGNARPWAFKDPRASLTLPFWRPLLPSARYVLCLRSPVEVAKSLDERDGVAEPRGYQLWLHYTAAAVANTANCPRLVVSYEAMLREPRGEMERLAAFLAVAGAELNDQRSEQAQESLRSTLRHHTTTTAATLADASVPLSVRALLLGMHMLSTQSPDDPEPCDPLLEALVAGMDKRPAATFPTARLVT